MKKIPHVLLCVSGGIAVYKACEVLRGLQKAGCDVRVAMTEDACNFVTPITFEVLSEHPVATDFYTYPESSIPHIELANWADLTFVVPATANIIAKMADGIADEIVSTTLLACSKDVLIAPAMNVHMWENPATQENLEMLKARGYHFIAPAEGVLACGEFGEGKLAAVDELIAGALDMLAAQGLSLDLMGKHFLITAGPTHEAIDPVRFIANASSGKTGYAIAAEAASRGARVSLISGPCALECPEGVGRISVTSAQEMYEASVAAFKDADVAILAAAVADYTPKAGASDHKLKKSEEHLESIELVETKDILKSLSQEKGSRTVVGFAAETDDYIAYAQDKLKSKGCDMIVANDVSRDDSAFGSNTRQVAFVTQDAVDVQPTLGLDDLAELIINNIKEKFLSE